MASTGNLWWTTPLQCIATIGMAANCGASGIASPIALPMLLLPSVPAKFQAAQMAQLLHNSEFIFPPCNGICTVLNLSVLVAAYLNRTTSRVAAEKLPWVAAAFGLGASVTVYTLTVMVPVNNSLKDSNAKFQGLKEGQEGREVEEEFRQREKKWQRLNYIRAALMIASAAAGMTALLKDGAVIRI